MNDKQFTAAQIDIMTVAAAHPDGLIEFFPANLKGGARKFALNRLEKEGFVEYRDGKPYITQDARTLLNAGRALADACATAEDIDAAVARLEAPDPNSALKQEIVNAAATHPDGLVEFFPAGLEGEARVHALAELAQVAMIEYRDGQPYLTPDTLRAVLNAQSKAEKVADTGVPAAAAETDAEAAALAEAVNEPAKRWAPKPGTKQAILLDAMRVETGVDVETLMAATGWQKHSVRGAISTLSSQPGIKITKEKVDGKLLYRCE